MMSVSLGVVTPDYRVHYLAKSGKSVAVLEAERVGWGASGRGGVGTGQRADQHSLKVVRQNNSKRAVATWAGSR